MASTASLWPAVVGVGGTVVGALVTALITLWNARLARIREEGLFAQTQDRAREGRVRAARGLAYEEWLRALRSFTERADAGAVDLDVTGLVDAMAQILDRLDLHASDDVRRAAAGELDLIRTYSASLTERRKLIERLRAQHEEIIALMRRDLA
jgi:hypothetical protein